MSTSTGQNNVYLYNRDSKGKVRVSIMGIEENNDGSYSIRRTTGLLNGKLIDQPEKKILKGKVKRTIKEQAELEFNSLISKQRDKGYKLFDELVSMEAKAVVTPLDYDVIDSLLGNSKTTVDGYNKPMLAQDATKQKESYLQRAWWVSRKLDGVRTLAHLEDDKVVFKSRGGKVYQGISNNFFNDPDLIKIMQEFNCELDGEFYCHGMKLKDINGICQLDDYTPDRHDQIEFHIFDIADNKRTADERVKILKTLNVSNPRVKIVEHTYCVGPLDIYELHDKWVLEGYEGAMARTINSMYEFGKRSKELLKFKAFLDDEFEIIGYEEGLRPIHDMVFVMRTSEGVEFKAKPLGDFNTKKEYVDTMTDLIGKKGTVTYQYMTEYGVPFLPRFKCVREDD